MPRPPAFRQHASEHGGLRSVNELSLRVRQSDRDEPGPDRPEGDDTMIKRYLLAASAFSLLAACGSAADPDATLEAVRATEQAQLQAIAGKDLRGAVRNYEDGAILVTPG